MRIRTFALPLIIFAAACRGDNSGAAGANGGTVVITTAGDADGFLPPVTASGPSAQVEQQIFERLAEPGPALNTRGDAGFIPLLATGWTWSADSLSIAFHIDPRARWHDGKPVTAEDVRFTLDLNRDSTIGSVVRPLVASIDSVTVRDSLTAVFWYTRRAPEQFFDATYQMRILPAHLLATIPRTDIANSPFRRNPVGSGPFKFVRWEPGQAIVLEANERYHLGRPHLDRVVFSIAPDPNTPVLRLLAGEADFLEYIRLGDFAEVAKHPELKTESYPAFEYGVVLFNLRDPKHPKAAHPVLGDRALRRALSMVVDRNTIVKSVFDTHAIVGHGPVTANYPTYDSTVALLPYAPDSAGKLLDALGWRRDKAGMRAKNGRPLAFGIVVPASSTMRRQMAVLLQEAFKNAGVHLEVEQVDFATLVSRLHQRDFDAVINASGLDPSPGNLRQSWGSIAGVPADGNYGSYESNAFNGYVDSALVQMSAAKAKEYFKLAYGTIIGDAPAIWMYEPHNTAGMQKRIHPVGWRADAWYANLRDWYIPAEERNARDRAAALPPLPAPPPPAAPAKP